MVGARGRLFEPRLSLNLLVFAIVAAAPAASSDASPATIPEVILCTTLESPFTHFVGFSGRLPDSLHAVHENRQRL